jgi:hypothetical protein
MNRLNNRYDERRTLQTEEENKQSDALLNNRYIGKRINKQSADGKTIGIRVRRYGNDDSVHIAFYDRRTSGG